jgi:hypothetical protein
VVWLGLQHTARFCRETLCAEPVVDFVSDNMLVWGGDVRTRTAKQVNSIL